MSKKVQLWTEQEYQNSFCIAHGLPIARQRGSGVDYHHPDCGWLEFVTNGQLEMKDVSRYPQLVLSEHDTRYSIIFLGTPPNTYDIHTMDRLGVRWAFWAITEHITPERYIENDNCLTLLGIVKSSVSEDSQNKEDIEQKD